MIHDNMKTVAAEIGILQLLYRHEMTCQRLLEELTQYSEEHIRLDLGDVLGLLTRYLQDGYVTQRRVFKERIPYVYYKMTASGFQYMVECLEEYRDYGYGINQLLQFLNSPDGGTRRPIAPPRSAAV